MDENMRKWRQNETWSQTGGLPNIIPKFLKSYKKLSSEEIILFTPKNVPFAKNF